MTSPGRRIGDSDSRALHHHDHPRRRQRRQRHRAHTLAIAAWLSLGLRPFAVNAQVIADPGAPANQRATILQDASGRPLVNIQTPSAAGVSRNIYSRFDVQSNGIVLNNARASNPWLATGEAKVILNEVRSSNPSYLGGAVLVNGSRAAVVVANPSGIQVDGATFANASRVTLSTGTPVIDAGLNGGPGALTGLDVRQGTVNINARGLNTSSVSFTDILSRAAVIAGSIKASEDDALQITTGVQTVDYATGQLTPGITAVSSTAAGPKPTVAIDTAALGGMYAGKITLLATEAGTGVRNAGTWQADATAGQLVVTADGRLENTGLIDAAITSVATVHGDIDNNGKLYSRALLVAQAGGDLNLNAGTRAMSMGGAVNGVNTLGQASLGAGRHINLAAGSSVSASGAVQLNALGQINANGASVRSSSADVLALAAQGIALTNSTFTAGQTLQLESGAPLQATLAPITITGGDARGAVQTSVLASGDVQISKPGGVALSSSAGHVDVQAGRNLTIGAGTAITAAQMLNLSAQGTLTLQGTPASLQTLPSGAMGPPAVLPTAVVKLSSGSHLQLSGKEVALQASNVQAGGNLAIEASSGSLTLSALRSDLMPSSLGAQLAASGNLSVAAYQGSITAEDLWATGQDIGILSNGNTWLTHSSVPSGQSAPSSPPSRGIAARGDLNIGSLNNTASVWLNGTATAGGQLKVMGDGAVKLTANNATTPVRLSGTHLAVQSGTSLTISGADLQASGNLALHANQALGLSNTTAKAGGNLALTSLSQANPAAAPTAAKPGIEVTATTLNAQGMLSVSNQSHQLHRASTFTGGAISLYTGMKGGMLSLKDTRVQTALPDPATASGAATLANLGDLGGRLSIESAGVLEANAGTTLQAATDLSLVQAMADLLIMPQPTPANAVTPSGLQLAASQMSAKRDLTLVARTGQLLLAGSDSAVDATPQAVALSSTRDIVLAGNSVKIQGSFINAFNQVNILATGGDVSLESLKVSYSNGDFSWQGPSITARQRVMRDAVTRTYDLLNEGAMTIQAAGNLVLDNAALATEGQLSLKSGGHLLTNGRFSHQAYTESDGTVYVGDFMQPTYLWGTKGVDIASLGGSLSLSGTAVYANNGLLRLQAMGDINLQAAYEHRLADRSSTTVDHNFLGRRKVTTTTVHNEAMTVTPVWLAGRDVELKAGNNVNTYATQFNAVNTLNVQAGNQANYYAVYDQVENNSNTHTSKSLWGIKYSGSRTADSRTILTGKPAVLQSQGSIRSLSGGDQLLQGTIANFGTTAVFEVGPIIAGDKPRIDAQIKLEGLKNVVQQSITRQSNYVLWQKMAGTGSTVETLVLPQFNGPTKPVLKGPVLAQIPAGEFKTQVNALIGQPGMGYLGELTTRTDVNWQPVNLAYDQWHYDQASMTKAGAALLAVVVAWVTAGAGSALLGTTTAVAEGASVTTVGGTVLGSTAGGVTTTTTMGAIVNAGFTALASQAAITLVNNKGDVGKTLKDLGNSSTAKATVAAMLTAGVLDKLGAIPEVKALNKQDAVFADKLTFNLINASGRALSNTAINGGKLEDALKDSIIGAVVDTAHGSVAGEIKTLEATYLAHKLAHALAGCLAGAAAGGNCQDGAIGSAAGEMVAELFQSQKPNAYAPQTDWDAYDAKVLAYSKIVAGAIAAYSGGNAQTAITTAETAVRNNFLTFSENQLRKQAAQACKATNDPQACADQKRFDAIDIARDNRVKEVCRADPGSQGCKDWREMALLAKDGYDGKTTNRAGALDFMTHGQYSDAHELQSIQNLINATPYNYFKNSSTLKSLVSLVADLTPIVGDVKAFYEASNPFDYAMAVVGALGPVGDGAKAAVKAAKLAHEAGNVAEAERQLVNAQKLVQEASGKKGSWSKAINGELDTHRTYELTHGYLYTTDTIGRVKLVEADDLTKVIMDRNTYQQCVVGKCGEIGDQGGHLIAATLGGAGDRINLVPQSATLNNGPWKAMENEFKAALDAGKKVSIKIEVGYPSGDGIRPNLFRVTASVDGVMQAPRIFNQ